LARRSGERGIALFAVGEATAARARAEGFSHVESAGGDVDDLARLACERLAHKTGACCMWRGVTSPAIFAGLLRDAGFATERVVLYEARPIAGLSPPTVAGTAQWADRFCAVLLAAQLCIFARLAEQAGVSAGLRNATAVSISAAADRALGELAFGARIMPSTPTRRAFSRRSTAPRGAGHAMSEAAPSRRRTTRRRTTAPPRADLSAGAARSRSASRRR